jgi:Uma2 family endonuclease
MSIRPKFPPEQQMTIEQFLAFAQTRPQEERWELIEGLPVLNPAPVRIHRLIAGNIMGFLRDHKRRAGASWVPLLGVGTRVPISPRSLPQPDVYVQEGAELDTPVTDDAIVIFEVLSPSNREADREWRQKVYASVPNCQHFVMVSTKAARVTVFDRSTRWAERKLTALDDSLELEAIGVSMPLAEMYLWTPLAK